MRPNLPRNHSFYTEESPPGPIGLRGRQSNHRGLMGYRSDHGEHVEVSARDTGIKIDTSGEWLPIGQFQGKR